MQLSMQKKQNFYDSITWKKWWRVKKIVDLFTLVKSDKTSHIREVYIVFTIFVKL